MKNKLLLALLCSAFLSPAFATGTTATDATTAPTTVTSEQMQNDGKVLAILVVLNTNEINAAKEAIKKSKNPQVKKFARLMNQDHGQNLKQTLQLSRKLKAGQIDSDEASTLKQKGQEEASTLSGLNGPDFDKTYTQAMVNGHEEALNMMDNDLLKASTSPAVKHHLEATRKHLVHHLEEAKKINA